MKKVILILLCATMLLCGTGCAAEKTEIVQPAAFYYRTKQMNYDGSTAIIDFEEREAAGFDGNMLLLLNSYFRGPASDTLTSPFPRNLKAVSYAVSGSTILLELSNELTQLSGIDLTVACACVSGTLLSIQEDAERVQIRVTGTYLNGSDAITMDKSSIMLLDFVDSSAVTEETDPESTQ